MTAYKIALGLIAATILATILACGGTDAPPADQQPTAAVQPAAKASDPAADEARIVELLDRRADEDNLQYDWAFASLAVCRMAEDRKATEGEDASRAWCLAQLDRPLEAIVTDWQAEKYGKVTAPKFWTPPK